MKKVVFAIAFVTLTVQILLLSSQFSQKTTSTPLMLNNKFSSVVIPYFKYAYADFSAIKLSMSIWSMTGDSGVTTIGNYKQIIKASLKIMKTNSHIIDYSYMFSGMLHGKALGNNELKRALAADAILTYGIKNSIIFFSENDFSLNKYLFRSHDKHIAWTHLLTWEIFFMRSMNSYLNKDIISRNSFNDMMMAYKLSGNKKFERLAITMSSKNNKNRIKGAVILYEQAFRKESDPVIKGKYKSLYEYYSFLMDMEINFKKERPSKHAFRNWLKQQCFIKKYNLKKYKDIEKGNNINGFDILLHSL